MPRRKKSEKAKSNEERAFRIVLGQLRSCVQAHGPITMELLGSASKRVSTALNGSVNEGHFGADGWLIERTVGRADEGACLENRSTGNGTVGSNPTPSAIINGTWEHHLVEEGMGQ